MTVPSTTSVPENRRIIASFAVALMGVAGCTSNSTGSPLPTRPTGGGQTVSSSPLPSSDNAAARLAGIDPCTLLTQAELDQYGLQRRESGNVAGARTCSWVQPTDEHGEGGFSLTPGIWDHQGLKDMNTDGYSVNDVVIGRHKARQASQISGAGCFVAIGVTDSSRVDVVASSDSGQSCSLANRFAKLIEPRLPGGG